jgi:hypothetical protein
VNGYVGLENSNTGAVRFKEIQVLPAAMATSTTRVTAAPTAVAVKGDRTSVAVSVDAGGTPATGKVQISVGGAAVTTVSLVDGKARASIGPFTSTGTTSITARYLGSDIVEPSVGSTTVAVRKATATLTTTVQPRRIVARKTRASVQVGVRARGVTPTGTVTVTFGKRSVSGTLVGGRVLVKLPRFAKAGTVRGTVTYRGDAHTTGVTRTLTLRVVKRKR